MLQELPLNWMKCSVEPASPCEYRTVSKDGRIICGKIVEGDNAASTAVCRHCPFRAVNCAHLRFALRLSSPSPLVVRFNGRTEVWDDDPPRLRFQQAACASQVIPIHSPDACATCPLRLPIAQQAQLVPQRRGVLKPGKVVPFPLHEPVAASG